MLLSSSHVGHIADLKQRDCAHLKASRMVQLHADVHSGAQTP